MTYTSLGKHLISGGVCLAFLGFTGILPQAPVEAASRISAAEKAEVQKLLIELRANRNQYVRARAASELGMIADPSSLDQLHRSLITDLSTQVRMNSANAIAKINQKSSGKKLLEALLVNRGRIDAQIAIIGAIGDMRGNSRDMIPAILKLLRSPSPFIREAAVDALWKIGDKKTSKYLVILLKREEDIMVKMTLCSTIADFKDPEAIRPLEKIARNAEEKPDLRALAQEALDILAEAGLKAPPESPSSHKGKGEKAAPH